MLKNRRPPTVHADEVQAALIRRLERISVAVPRFARSRAATSTDERWAAAVIADVQVVLDQATARRSSPCDDGERGGQ